MYALAEEIVGGIANENSTDSTIQDSTIDNEELQPSTWNDNKFINAQHRRANSLKSNYCRNRTFIFFADDGIYFEQSNVKNKFSIEISI